MSDSFYASTEDHFSPYRRLAIRVLARALQDVMNADGAPADRESARVFLDGSGMLLHWCRVAALDPTLIVRLAQKLGGTRTQGSSHVDVLGARTLRTLAHGE